MKHDRPTDRSSHRQTWDDALAVLRARVGESCFERFVRPLHLVSFDAETARLEAPDRLTLTYAQQELVEPIREALARLVGPRDVVIELQEAEQGELLPVERRRRPPVAEGFELQARYTFDTFVVGASNQFAHAACLAVARQPGEHYNPLFIYGGVGLGKTHLASAIGNAIVAENLGATVGYVSAERFMTQLITAIRGDDVELFKRRYRDVDVLIVDDIQLLAGRDRTQEEFFHTFNALHDVGRQIVVTSDKVPEDIPGLEARLRNRFQWGLVADIQPPDLETRVAILGRKAEAQGIHLPEDAAMLLAEQIASNVRSLEGALTRVAAHASLDGVRLSADYVRELMARGALGRHGPITFEDIAQAVCERYGLSVAQLLSRRRTKQVAMPRQVAMYLCRRLLDVSYPRLGNLFGRDHTTALHGVRTISAKIERDAVLQETITTLERRLGQG